MSGEETNFQKVINFNYQFGVTNTIQLTKNSNILKEDPKLAEFCFKLVNEEINETAHAIDQYDSIEFIDGLADSLFVIYGNACRLGVNLDDEINKWYDSKLGDLFDTTKDHPKSNFVKVIKHDIHLSDFKHKVLSFKSNTFNDCREQVYENFNPIRHEREKLKTSILTHEYHNVITSLVNLTYYVYSIGYKMGVNLDLAFDAVYRNNMSKLCLTESEAQLTVKHYFNNVNKLGYDTPNYRPAPDGVHWVVYNESTRKILKSINWKPVNLKFMLNDESDVKQLLEH